jgi:predicted GIY-YIG superfamily endonuclease
MPIKWTYEELLKVSKTCKHRSELQDKWSGAFKFAVKNNLLDELFPVKFPNHDDPDVWTYDECKKIAKEYKNISHLQRDYPGASKAIRRYGWLDDFYPNRKTPKERADYESLSYEKCRDISEMYKNPSELMENNRPVYNVCNKNEWLKDFFPNYTKPTPSKTYDECKELIAKYKSNYELREKNHILYENVRRCGWFDLLDTLERRQNKSGYWTYEKCKEYALKCKSRKELGDVPKTTIYRNGWYELLDHMVNLPTLGHRYVYSFEFPDKSVYVGLSYNPEKRKTDHLCEGSTSKVREYRESTGLSFDFKILTDKLVMLDASHEERRYIRQYKENGWKILNGNKGGSLGGGKKKYTYEQCKNKVSEYKSLKDFCVNANGYYCRIKNEKWEELLSPLLRYKDYLKSMEYYEEKYPELIKLLKNNVKNGEIRKITGVSTNVVWLVKKRLIKTGVI